jgi:hypothetical protein
MGFPGVWGADTIQRDYASGRLAATEWAFGDFGFLAMCGACGILGGGPDWLDRVDNPGGVPPGEGLTRVAERQRRVALVNTLLAPKSLRVRDFGRQMILTGATGRTHMISDLKHVWLLADQLVEGGIDPLDPTTMRVFEQAR